MPHSLCDSCHNIQHVTCSNSSVLLRLSISVIFFHSHVFIAVLHQGYTDLSNFEIGVMFHTRPDKDYRALNPDCTVHGNSTAIIAHGKEALAVDMTKSSVVILPFPFDLEGGVPYYEEDEARFKHRPFFNGTSKEVCPLFVNKSGRELISARAIGLPMYLNLISKSAQTVKLMYPRPLRLAGG